MNYFENAGCHKTRVYSALDLGFVNVGAAYPLPQTASLNSIRRQEGITLAGLFLVIAFLAAFQPRTPVTWALHHSSW